MVASLSLCSCSTYTAILKNHDDLGDEVIRAYPAWKYDDPGTKKLIVPAIAAAIGATYGYRNETTIGDETFTGKENASIWAVGGLAVGSIINAALFPPRSRAKATFDLKQSDKWVKSLNQSTGTDYVVRKKERDNTLILVPEQKMREARSQFNALAKDLKQSIPTTSFSELQAWKNSLNGEYYLLSVSEIAEMQELIETHETKVSRKELLSKMYDTERLTLNYEVLSVLERLRSNHYDLYQSADPPTQRKFDDLLDKKTSEALTKLMREVEDEISAIENSITGWQTVNTFALQFDRKYSDWFYHPIVKPIDDKLTSKIQQIVAAQTANMETKIKSSNHVNQLNQLEISYFSFLKYYELPSIAGFTSRIVERRAEIIEAERQRIAQQAREKRRAEAKALERYGFTFKTFGLENEELIEHFFKGNFDQIPFNRDEEAFASFIGEYMIAYSDNCASNLPYNSIEITERVCNEKYVTRDWLGNITSSYCVEWINKGTGIYANPKLYSAYKTIQGIMERDIFKTMIGMIQDFNQDGFNSINNRIVKHNAIKSDIIDLVQMNGCNNKALKRFEENLIRFAHNKASIRLDGRVEQRIADYSKEQNWDKLTEDLVKANSRTWTFRYISNSVKNVHIAAKDQLNHPKRIVANYTFEGLSGYQNDQVEITFKEGLPDCIYFSNYSSNCRTPDRKIISKFVNGDYIKY